MIEDYTDDMVPQLRTPIVNDLAGNLADQMGRELYRPSEVPDDLDGLRQLVDSLQEQISAFAENNQLARITGIEVIGGNAEIVGETLYIEVDSDAQEYAPVGSAKADVTNGSLTLTKTRPEYCEEAGEGEIAAWLNYGVVLPTGGA